MAWLTADDLAAFDAGLDNAQVYGPEQMTSVIADVEAELERIIGTAYDRRTVTDEWHLGDGGGWLHLDHRWPVSVSAATIGGTALSAGTLAGLTVDRVTGSLYLSSGWTAGEEILVTYVHGRFTTATVNNVTTYSAAPPADLLRAAKMLCVRRLADTRAPIGLMSERYVADGGGTFVLATPGPGRPTGIPAVDAIVNRYVIPGIR